MMNGVKVTYGGCAMVVLDCSVEDSNETLTKVSCNNKRSLTQT